MQSHARVEALHTLGVALRVAGYSFVTVTPETHRRVLARGASGGAPSLRDIFGWNLPFRAADLPMPMMRSLDEANALVECEGMLKSAVRFSSLDGKLFVHSGYPTTDENAVFFGPDTYRFCNAIRRFSGARARIVDIGCGSGAGGIVASTGGGSVVLADINPEALALAHVNARLSETTDCHVIQSDVLGSVEGAFDLILANPPYLLDGAQRTYRHGGGSHGEALSVRILRDSLPRLRPGGSLLLYTGAAICDGRDVFRDAAFTLLDDTSFSWSYEEVDPDVFGEELETPAYRNADRIAAVVLTVRRR